MLLLISPTFFTGKPPRISCVARVTLKIEQLHLSQKFNDIRFKDKIVSHLKMLGATIAVPATMIFALFVQV